MTLSTIISIVIASVFLHNAFQGSMNLMREGIAAEINGIRDDINLIRDDMDLMRADIRELQDKTTRIDAKLELLLNTWGLDKPSLPTIAKNQPET